MVVVLELREARAQPPLQRRELGDLALLLGNGLRALRCGAAGVLEHRAQLRRALAPGSAIDVSNLRAGHTRARRSEGGAESGRVDGRALAGMRATGCG